MEKQLHCKTVQDRLFEIADKDFHRDLILTEINKICRECVYKCQK